MPGGRTMGTTNVTRTEANKMREMKRAGSSIQEIAAVSGRGFQTVWRHVRNVPTVVRAESLVVEGPKVVTSASADYRKALAEVLGSNLSRETKKAVLEALL